MNVPTGVWVGSIIILVIVAWMTFYVTNKAYSKKWEEEDSENKTY